jgi:RNA polymerase sigma-70 factor (ECF subfamily)
MSRALVEEAIAGDRGAFVALATNAYARLFGVARLILRDDERAADATQDALTAAWLHVRAVRDPDRFNAWLYRLTVRASYREAARRRRTSMEIDVTPIDIADEHDVAAGVVVKDQLERAFRRLTAEQRAVLVAHHYLALPDAEAAAVLAIPVGTMKSRLNRATRALRAAIEADERSTRAMTEVPA